MTFYDANLRDGSIFNLGLRFNNDGNIDFIEGVPKTSFSRSLWQVYREARSDSDYQPRQIQNFLDSPFYSRSKIRTKIQGNEVEGVHEALDLNRFANPLIKPMLALRIPESANKLTVQLINQLNLSASHSDLFSTLYNLKPQHTKPTTGRGLKAFPEKSLLTKRKSSC